MLRTHAPAEKKYNELLEEDKTLQQVIKERSELWGLAAHPPPLLLTF